MVSAERAETVPSTLVAVLTATIVLADVGGEQRVLRAGGAGDRPAAAGVAALPREAVGGVGGGVPREPG